MLHYAGLSCERTEKMKVSEIKDALSVFFSPDNIEEAIKILCSDDDLFL